MSCYSGGMNARSASAPGSSTTAEAAPSPLRRRLRRVMIIASAILLVVVAVGFLLPIWASTTQGRAYILQRLNRDLAARLDVQRWSLGWFSGMEFHDVTLDAPDGRRLFQCARIKTDLTLWGYLWGNYDVGATTIESPRLTASAYVDGSNDLSRLLGASSAWDNVTGSLRGVIRIQRGEVVLRAPGTVRECRITDIAAEIPVASPSTTVYITLRANATDGLNTRPVAVTGHFPPLASWPAAPAAMLRDMELQAGAVPVAPLAAWLGLSTQWEDSFGPLFDEIAFSSHLRPGGADCTPALRLRGSRGEFRARLLMPVRGDAGALSLQLPTGRDFHFTCRMAPSVPAADLLAYANPMLRHMAAGKGTVALTLSEGSWTAGQPGLSRAAGLLVLSDTHLHDAGLVRDLHGVVQPVKRGRQDTLALDVPPTRLQIGRGRIRCEPFLVALPGMTPLRFSGYTTLDAELHLLVRVSAPAWSGQGALGSSTVDVLVTGTVQAPQLSGLPAAAGGR